MTAFPSPADLGIQSFARWRPVQERAFEAIFSDDDQGVRITALSMPTAAGKSGVPIGLWGMTRKRTVILTHTKQLQTQYGASFSDDMGLVDVRGQVAYRCRKEPQLMVPDGPCHWGGDCAFLPGGCYYFDAVARARRASLLNTNYACILSHNRYTDGLGPVHYLFCDEADVALDALSSFLSVRISQAQSRRMMRGLDLPDTSCTNDEVRSWARLASDKLLLPSDVTTPGLPPSPAQRRQLRELEEMRRSLDTLTVLDEGWIAYIEPGRNQAGPALNAQPITPSRYIDRCLYHYKVPADKEHDTPAYYNRVPRIILMSATLPEKEVQRLAAGIPYSYRDFPSTIPVANRRIWHIETTAMSRSKSPDLNYWVSRADQIIDRRLDRKGIFHTTSYERRNLIMTRSRFRDSGLLISHDSHDLEAAVQEFKRRRPPCLLVSPSIVRGLDLPYDDARYAIFGKVPAWPPPDPIIEARRAEDPDYPAFEAMKALQQAAGRVVRFEDDWAELFILDDDCRWFLRKYSEFACAWFRESIAWQSLKMVPEPRLLDGERSTAMRR